MLPRRGHLANGNGQARGDVHLGTAGPRDRDALVGQPAAGQALRAQERREHDGARALHVVVEATHAVTVARQLPQGVGPGEVLKLINANGNRALAALMNSSTRASYASPWTLRYRRPR